MPNKKTNETPVVEAPAVAEEKLFSLFVDRGVDGDDPNEYVCINGKRWVLPKGETSMVPEIVKKEYERSQRAKARMYRNRDKLIKRTQSPTNQQ